MTPPPIVKNPATSRWQIWVVSLGAIIVAGAVALGLKFDPAWMCFLPVCPLHELTGLHCPGCGMTRATLALLHGQFLAALHFNALYVLALPVAAVVSFVRVIARRRGRKLTPLLQRPSAVWWLLGVVIVFGILRNIPVYPFTLLAP